MSEENPTTERPNNIIQDMYLEINNIAQGINIGIFVFVLANPDFYNFQERFYSSPIFILASFLISVIFWTRYYFDTEILNRSYTVVSTVWFFCYLISQGVSISMVTQPANWLFGTGAFLFFGAGFYWLNLIEIRRKENRAAISLPHGFTSWQWRRLIELLVVSILSIIGGFIVSTNPASALLAAVFALLVAIWQLVVAHDYRKYRFIETGV
jgi:hypothetical protein